jgi:hypothetical protein
LKRSKPGLASAVSAFRDEAEILFRRSCAVIKNSRSVPGPEAVCEILGRCFAEIAKASTRLPLCKGWGVVYAMRAGRYVKIGWVGAESKLKWRVTQVRNDWTKRPSIDHHTTRIIGYVKGPRSLETQIHKELACKRTKRHTEFYIWDREIESYLRGLGFEKPIFPCVSRPRRKSRKSRGQS